MTDRNKSQRKRRLQLNAEEFAPPSDLYEASAEPRLDETWVQYYGGEKHGGLKRLLPVEEEVASGQPEDAPAAPSPPAAPATHHESPDEAHHIGPHQTPEAQETEALGAASPDRPSRPVVSSLEDFRKHEPAKTAVANPPPAPARAAVNDPPAKRITTAGVEKRAAVSPSAPSSSPQVESGAPSFEEWAKRWAPWLKRGGSIKVCAAFFELTHVQGSAECFTSNSAIMEITKLSRAQCIRNIHYLIEIGFLDELSEVNSREAKGTYYRFNLVPRSLVST